MVTREGQVPLALPSDRQAIEIALHSSLAGSKPRVCRIRSTAQLEEFWVSEGLLNEVREQPNLTVLEKPHPLEFDAAGNLF